MRFVAIPSLLILSASLSLACGGGGTPVETPKGGGDPAGSSSGTTADAADAGPTTTTTSTLPDGGDLTGVKLQHTSNVTVINDAGVRDAALDPRVHDPGRSPQDIMTIVAIHRDEARACYDATLKAHPGLEGNLNIKWTIDPKGNVTETSIDDAKSDIHEATVGKCIGDVIKKIKFAESPRGVETHAFYPFNFHPRGPQPPH